MAEEGATPDGDIVSSANDEMRASSVDDDDDGPRRPSHHSRNVTPHTASLMGLFARPPTSEASPLAPDISYGAVRDDTGRVMRSGVDSPRSPPSRGKFCEHQNDNITPTFQNSTEKRAFPAPPLLVTPSILHSRQHTEVTCSRSGEADLPIDTRSTTDMGSQMEFMSAISKGRADETYGLLPGAGGSVTAFRESNFQKILTSMRSQCSTERMRPTVIGAVTFSLYQIVFCLAEASVITRPSHPAGETAELLSPMALMACVGTLFSCPMLIAVLGGDNPALYPCVDMFIAPFLAHMAADIDSKLVELGLEDDTATFLATFVALNSFGVFLSGALCKLAGRIKLANLANYLPYPVICGFFSSVGISLWMSAFKVDTGITIQNALRSNTWTEMLKNLTRHSASLIAGFCLFLMGQRGPIWIIGVLTSTVLCAYTLMMLTGTTLKVAQDNNFFWQAEEVTGCGTPLLFDHYGPPKPFGLVSLRVLEKICWPAFVNGLPGVLAACIIFLMRCTLHAAALKKVVAQNKASAASLQPPSSTTATSTFSSNAGNMFRNSEKPRDILTWYANGFFLTSLSGGFPCLPAISLGSIFFKLGAWQKSPQALSMILLFVAGYVLRFSLVSFIPKAVFSSLLNYAAFDMLNTWLVKSYQKDIVHEWVVVPLIVIVALFYGMLASIGCGLAGSTIIFVGMFYRAGVVKCIANGLMIRSTVDRNLEDNEWLDQNADMIQILVLQNYLFFGNAKSICRFVQTMFDEPQDISDHHDLPPIPKHIIIDLSIVTGIDSSAVDVIMEIVDLCKAFGCKMIFAGVPEFIRPFLTNGGVRPSTKNKHISYEPDLDLALGKAEDGLLKDVALIEERMTRLGKVLKHRRRMSCVDHGLRYALKTIDHQHHLNLAPHLQSLEKETTPIELKPGQRLGISTGLFFIESGLLKCEADSSASLTRGAQLTGGLFAAPHMRADNSIGKVNARSATVGKGAQVLKSHPGLMSQTTFRIARVGPGMHFLKSSLHFVQLTAPLLN